MTIVVGIKCTDGIVVACDSRTTDPSGHVHDDAQKIGVVTLQDGMACLVARAGHDGLSARAFDIMVALSKGMKFADYRTFADLAERAVSDLKLRIREQFKGTAEELQRHFSDYSFELMIMNYCGSPPAPLIFTLDFVLGMAVRKDRLYVSMGCGWILSDFLLSSLDVKNFNREHAMATAIYAVEEIKKFDSRCGGPTVSALLMPNEGSAENAPRFVGVVGSGKWMEETVKYMADFSRESKAEWKGKMEGLIRRIVANRLPVEIPPKSGP